MRAVIQRVSQASVRVDDQIVGEIGPGLLILLGVTHDDSAAEAQWLADKIARLRIFPDEAGAMNRSLIDTGGNALVVSQFTLHARVRKGTRPSFNDAAPGAIAEPLYEAFKQLLSSALGRPSVASGRFGAMMQVSLVNDGPVTLVIDIARGE